MSAGRKNLPTVIKEMHGEHRKNRLNRNEPSPERGSPEPPEFLTEGAKKEWKYISYYLDKIGMLTKIDKAALAAYCQAYDRWARVEELLKQRAERDRDFGGMLELTSNGNVVQTPLLGVANRAIEIMSKFLTEFGMTPASRARLVIEPPSEGGEKDELQDFENRRKIMLFKTGTTGN